MQNSISEVSMYEAFKYFQTTVCTYSCLGAQTHTAFDSASLTIINTLLPGEKALEVVKAVQTAQLVFLSSTSSIKLAWRLSYSFMLKQVYYCKAKHPP